MKKLLSLGQVVKNMHKNNFSNSYFLYGNDIFMQDFFISELKKIKPKLENYLYYLGYDNQEAIFNELSNLSLFDSEKIIIIKNINRFTSKAKQDLLDYLSNNNNKYYLVLVKNNFDARNKFIDSLINRTTPIDVRTPFDNKMKEWLKYFTKREKIDITDSEIKDYIDAYGSNISNVMNYIRIDSIQEKLIINKGNRKYHLWNLQDSIGQKTLNKSLDILKSLLLNGNTINLIIIYLFSLYKYIYNFSDKNSSLNYNFMINKIIQSKINTYSTKYSKYEIENIILKLKELDFLSKNSTLNINNAMLCLITNICTGYYERQN